ncbi:hypothetical protein [Tenacibaculum sp. IB213877]|uniref:hypothetical protein n=1 Tax=Tenacibaculum sp. IB213877 TaxID=3097351 RepID=UPI002A59DF89|nr:hypothetical protein [Tenacibaculum sp. IB213877]MDY0780612.1 hypothetical protein [Tenacibaculum sp. IB213877]
MKKNFQIGLFLLIITSFFSCKINTKQTVNKKYSPTKFEYSPIKPKDGKLKGVIELGNSGFNSFVIEVDKDNNWELKRREFGSSLISEGMTNSSEVNLKLKDYIDKFMLFGLQKQDISFVVSSGALKEEITQKIVHELKELKYQVEIITPEQEGKYALQALLPEQFKDSSFIVDMGSGNLKIGYIEEGKITTKETLGSKYYQKGIEDSVVYEAVKATAMEIPKKKRQRCFIIGGVPYHLAASVRIGKERYTQLSPYAEDFAKVAKEKGKKLQSGLVMYKAIYDATNCTQIIFDWDANFSIGYLLEKNKSQ